MYASHFSPEYKRLAALQGDLVFQAPRRNLLEIASKTQPAYSYSMVSLSYLFITHSQFSSLTRISTWGVHPRYWGCTWFRPQWVLWNDRRRWFHGCRLCWYVTPGLWFVWMLKCDLKRAIILQCTLSTPATQMLRKVPRAFYGIFLGESGRARVLTFPFWHLSTQRHRRQSLRTHSERVPWNFSLNLLWIIWETGCRPMLVVSTSTWNIYSAHHIISHLHW